MRRKEKFGSRKIYINNDLTQVERDVQSKLRETVREEGGWKENKSRI